MRWGDGYHEKISKQCCGWILHGECGGCISDVHVGFSPVSLLCFNLHQVQLLSHSVLSFLLSHLHNHLESQLFVSLFGYIEDRLLNNLPVDGERLNGFVCLVQSILLASFATILASHRSEILDQKISDDDDIAYEAPSLNANEA